VVTTRFGLLATVAVLGAVVPARAADKAPRPAAAPAVTSVAVFNLETQAGLTDGVAKLMTEHVAALLRESSAFGRVVASADLASLVDLERQKQMANCANDSCMAELAGALGVDFLVTGSIGKLGDSYLLNIKLLDVKRAVTKGSVSERFTGKSEEALLDGVQPAVFKLLNMCGVKHTLAPQGRVGVAPAAVASEMPAAQQQPLTATPQPAPASPPAPLTPPSQRAGWVVPTLGAGAFAGVAGVLVLGVAFLAGVGSATWFGVMWTSLELKSVLGSGEDRPARVIGSTGVGALLAGLLALLGVLVVGAGVTMLAVGVSQF
jgi:TolB-like protein